MTKRMILALLIGVLVAPTGAIADTDGVVLCWKAAPYADLLQVWALSPAADD